MEGLPPGKVNTVVLVKRYGAVEINLKIALCEGGEGGGRAMIVEKEVDDRSWENENIERCVSIERYWPIQFSQRIKQHIMR